MSGNTKKKLMAASLAAAGAAAAALAARLEKDRQEITVRQAALAVPVQAKSEAVKQEGSGTGGL